MLIKGKDSNSKEQYLLQLEWNTEHYFVLLQIRGLKVICISIYKLILLEDEPVLKFLKKNRKEKRVIELAKAHLIDTYNIKPQGES